MKLPKISVNRPVTTLMVFLAILLFGLVAIFRLPLDIMPKMELPTLTVITTYPGASAKEVEQQVSKPLEEQLAGAENLQELTSTSKENVSFVKLQYDWGMDLTEAANNARDLIELAKSDLPDDAESPVIYKISSSMIPVLMYGISADENYMGIENIIDDQLAAPIRKTSGVGSAIYLGHPERQIQIKVNPRKLKAYHLSIPQISKILEAENISIPGGNIKSGEMDFAVQVPGEFSSVSEIRETVLTKFENNIIRLKDVAQVSDSFRDKEEFADIKSGRCVVFMVQKQSGANTVDVVNRVRKKMADIKKDLPPDVTINEVFSGDEIVVQSLNNLSRTILYAWIFVIMVVFIFLREWKSSFIVFLSIPFSLIAAFIAIFLLDWTINIFSLIAIVIAIGMVVDNAIVVLENITTHIERGSKPKQAAIFGTSEMGTAITASATTTISVFLPMVFMGGIVGILFQQLAILVSVTLIAALITALTLIPSISSNLLPKSEERKKYGKLYNVTENLLHKLEKGYQKALETCLNHRMVTIGTVLIIFVITIFVSRTIRTDYLPEFDAGDVAVVFKTETGTRAEETRKVSRRVMKIVDEVAREKVPGTLFSVSGQTEKGLLSSVGFEEGKNIGTVMCHLKLPSDRERTAKEIGNAIRKRLENIPEIVNFRISAGSLIQSGIMENQEPIEVEISGNDFEQLEETAQKIKTKMANIDGIIDLQSTTDKGKLEAEVRINRTKASDLALNSALIGSQIRSSIYGSDVGNLAQKGEEYGIKIQYNPQYRNSVKDLKQLQIVNLNGKSIPLSAVADIEIVSGMQEINRQSQQRIVKVKAGLEKNFALSTAADQVRKITDNLDAKQGVNIELAGQIESQGESFSDLYLILGMGIILVYMVMASQFESFKNPFVIMFSLPLTFIGVIWAFKITGTTLSVNSFIGAIMLIGIVVNNGIVLVDYINLMRKRGKTLREAILKGGRSRMRPVLMTSFTTILAMIPMALSKGMGHEMFVPMAITMIGGLLVATLITLLFIPTLYSVFNKN